MKQRTTQRIAKRVFINPQFKDRAIVLKNNEETNGAYLLGQLEVAPGGGNNLHTHSSFEETFIAIQGILGIKYGGKEIYLNPGDTFTIPKKQPHAFFNSGQETITCQVKLSPGHEGFIKGIAILYGLAADGKTNKKGVPRSLTHLALFFSLADTIPTGGLSLLAPLFRWLAARARKRGVERELLEKYYYV
jgi:mannose-6-phosphate isomerase-like protein (cupin superfamily)